MRVEFSGIWLSAFSVSARQNAAASVSNCSLSGVSSLPYSLQVGVIISFRTLGFRLINFTVCCALITDWGRGWLQVFGGFVNFDVKRVAACGKSTF